MTQHGQWASLQHSKSPRTWPWLGFCRYFFVFVFFSSTAFHCFFPAPLCSTPAANLLSPELLWSLLRGCWMELVVWWKWGGLWSPNYTSLPSGLTYVSYLLDLSRFPLVWDAQHCTYYAGLMWGLRKIRHTKHLSFVRTLRNTISFPLQGSPCVWREGNPLTLLVGM